MEFEDRWFLHCELEWRRHHPREANGGKISYALRLEFSASNNEAEYKALLGGLYLAKEMRVE